MLEEKVNKNIVYLVSLGFLFIGIVFIVISLGMRTARRKAEELCTVSVSAIIVSVVEESSYSSMDHTKTRSWYPVYEYAYKDELYKIKSNIGGLQSDYKIGTKITLLINPDKPTQFYNTDDKFDILVNIFLFAGTCMCSFGIASALIFWKIFCSK